MSHGQLKSEDIERLVISEFSSKAVVEHFTAAAKLGLWPTEQTLIARYFEPGLRILDLGCGVGRTTLPLAKLGFDVIGVDISPQMIEAAHELAAIEGLPIEYEVGNAIQLRFPDGAFDYVLFSNQGWTQIPGARNRVAALSEIRRVLRDGGMFLFSTHTRPRAIHPTWVWRWLSWHARKAFRKNPDGVDFGDILFIRDLPVEHSMKQYVHVPTRAKVQKLLRVQSFQLLETIRECTVRHDPVVYIARLNLKNS